MDGEVLARMKAAGRTGWLPIEDDVQFVDAIVAECGEAGAIELIRASVNAHFAGALLASLVKGAQRIFGMSPAGLMKMVPRAWPMVYRGFGQPRFELEGAGHAWLHVEGAHPLAFTAPGYLASWRGMFAGIVDVGTRGPGAEPRVELHVDAAQARFSIETRWSVEG